MKHLTLLFITLIFFQISFGQIKRYSPDKVAEDFEYLYKNLKVSHYNFFTNTSEKDYNKEYQKIQESIKDSLTSIQILRLFQPFVALDEHMHCYLKPFNLYGEYYKDEGTVFPFHLCIRKNMAFIVNNFSSNKTILPGDEIISINEKSIKDILDDMNRFISGESDYLKSVWIEMITFPRTYWIVYDRYDSFNLEIRKKDGKLIKTTINAISTEEFEEELAMQKPMFDNRRKFHFVDKNTAYLHPGGFTNLDAKNEHETSDNRKFCRFIDSAFIEMHNLKTKNLIIDLRNNGGGINNFSDYMLSYIADKPFRFSEKFMVRTSKHTKEFWKDVNDSSMLELRNDIMTKEDGTRFINTLPYNQPYSDSLQFTGKVFVLINRYVLSQAVLTAAMVQDYNFGVLVGEETGDHSSLFGSSHSFSLPNTNLEVVYPKAFIVRPNGDEKAKGVLPDFRVVEDPFNEKDEILDYTLNLIRKGE